MKAALLAGRQAAAGGELYDAILAQSPLSFWPLRELVGTTFLDTEGNDGTWQDGVTLANQSAPDAAGYPTFAGTGTNPGGSAPGDPSPPDYSIATNSGITIVAAVYQPASTSPTGTIVSKNHETTSSNREWNLFLNAGTPYADVLNGTSLSRRRAASAALNTGWNVIIVQMSAVDVAPSIRLNGSLVNGSSPGTGTGATNNGAIQIGRQLPGSSSTVIGSNVAIGLVAIFAGVAAGIPTALEAAASSEGWY